MRKELVALLVIGLAVVVAAVIGSSYYRTTVQNDQKVTPSANLKLVRPDNPTLGPADAKGTLVEFFDPECETCAAYHPFVKQLLQEIQRKDSPRGAVHAISPELAPRGKLYRGGA